VDVRLQAGLFLVGACLLVLGLAFVLSSHPPQTSAAGESITSPDTTFPNGSTLGAATSLALDGSGYPVVAYHELSSLNLRVLHCNDPKCAGGNESIVSPDAVGDVGRFASLVLDGSQNPVVAYLDLSNGYLKLLHCNDLDCTGGGDSITSPDTGGQVFSYISLALDSSGYPVVSYSDPSTDYLKLLHCNDANCDPAVNGAESITTPDSTGSAGFAHTSLVLDSAGYPVVSYYDQTSADLRILHCNDANCDASVNGPESIAFPDTGGNVGEYTSIELDSPTGYPVVSYYKFTGGDGGDLRLLHCDDANCAGDESTNITSPDTTGDVGRYTSLELDGSAPVISYHDYSNGDLKVMRCNDADCSGSDETITSPDTVGTVGLLTSLALDSSQNAVVSYFDDSNQDLKLLHCASAACKTMLTPTATPELPTATPTSTPTPYPISDIDGSWGFTLYTGMFTYYSCSDNIAQTGSALQIDVKTCDYPGFNAQQTNKLTGTITGGGSVSASGTVSCPSGFGFVAPCTFSFSGSAILDTYANLRRITGTWSLVDNFGGMAGGVFEGASSAPPPPPPPPPLTVTISGIHYVVEGESAVLTAILNRDPDPGTVFQYKFQTQADTASAGADYVETGGVLSFVAGSLERTILVPTVDDADDEGFESFQLGGATVHIQDDDGILDLRVNTGSDGSDASIGDGGCDADAGTPNAQCTMRAAIQEANARSATTDLITLITNSSPTSALPSITDPVVIDGEPTIPGYTLDGSGAGAGAIGLALGLGSSGSTIRDLGIQDFSVNGITVLSDSNIIEGNSITGNGGHGVSLGLTPFSPSTGNIVGYDVSIPTSSVSSCTGPCNEIAGNGGAGVFISNDTTSNRIEGNFIGTNGGQRIDWWPTGPSQPFGSLTGAGTSALNTNPPHCPLHPVHCPSDSGHTFATGYIYDGPPSEVWKTLVYVTPPTGGDPCSYTGPLRLWASGSVTADANGDFSAAGWLVFNPPVSRPAGLYFTITDASGKTGEYGNCVPVGYDGDADGIQDAGDNIDGTWDGSTFTANGAFSSSFTDQHLGGITYGTITDRGGGLVNVADAPSPAGVVLGYANFFTSDPGKVDLCAGLVLIELATKQSTEADCGGSARVRVEIGPVTARFSGFRAIAGNGMVFTVGDPGAGGTFDVDNSSASPGKLTIIHEASSQQITLQPGQSARCTTATGVCQVVIDTDDDGCTDVAEGGGNPAQGGLRNAASFWDFYDVWGQISPGVWRRDRTINVFDDILGVARRYGAIHSLPYSKQQAYDDARLPPAGASGYHAAFDRGPQIGQYAWNVAPADGAINIFDDILGVAAQYGHSCA
jgi:hypothetical protein